MTFTIIDVALIVIVFFFVGFGYAIGAVQTFGGILGLGLGVYCSGLWYEKLADWLSPLFLGNENWPKIIAFVLIFIAIDRLVAIIFGLLDKAFNLMSFVPFVKTFSRLIGGAFGLLEGAFICGLLIYINGKFPISEWLTNGLASSQVAEWCVAMSNVLLWMIPEALQQVKSSIPYLNYVD